MEVIKSDTPEFIGLIKKIDQAIADTKMITEQYRPSIMGERYYTGEEIMEKLHLSKRTLQNYRDDGTLPYTKIGDKILYRNSDIARILEENYVAVVSY